MISFKKIIFILFGFLAFISSTHANNKLNVFVSILPQQYFVERVGANEVDVNVMVGPGQNPATYEPTTQQMAALANADIYFSINVPFEKVWLKKIKENNPELVIVECCPLLSTLVDIHEHRHGTNGDPHIWTNPENVIYITNLIKDSLTAINADNKNKYFENAESFINELVELDSMIRAETKKLNNRSLLVAHPSWSYFAKSYGFEQLALENAGKEIQAGTMVKLIEIAKNKNIKAVFVQPQFSKRTAKVIARELNAEIYELDPLAFNYMENMQDVTHKIVKGLSNE